MIFKQTLEAFGVTKQPQGDGMSTELLFNYFAHLLGRAFTITPLCISNFCPLILRILTFHVNVWLSIQKLCIFITKCFSYQAYLQAKLAELHAFVKSNLTTTSQKVLMTLIPQYQIFKLMT